MHKGKLIFAQLNEHLPKPIFRDCVKRYAGRYPTLSFSHWDQLLCMMFAQLTARTSLRDIELCLGSHSRKLYHAGFRSQVARSTLADANERRDCRIFEDFAMHLIGVARKRILGYDNAHAVKPPKKFKYAGAKLPYDHNHRHVSDKGVPYEFKDAHQLLSDFFVEVDRVLKEARKS